MQNEKYKDLKGDERQQCALELACSLRGHFILSQALVIAIRELEEVPAPYTEWSNICDMKLLLEQIFPMYQALEDAKMARVDEVVTYEDEQTSKEMGKEKQS